MSVKRAPFFANALWATLFKNLFSLRVLLATDVETVALRLNRELRTQLRRDFVRILTSTTHDALFVTLQRARLTWLVQKTLLDNDIHTGGFNFSIKDGLPISFDPDVVKQHVSTVQLIQLVNAKRRELYRCFQLAVLLDLDALQYLLMMCAHMSHFLRSTGQPAHYKVTLCCASLPKQNVITLQLRAKNAVNRFQSRNYRVGKQLPRHCLIREPTEAANDQPRQWPVDVAQLTRALRSVEPAASPLRLVSRSVGASLSEARSVLLGVESDKAPDFSTQTGGATFCAMSLSPQRIYRFQSVSTVAQ